VYVRLKRGVIICSREVRAEASLKGAWFEDCPNAFCYQTFSNFARNRCEGDGAIGVRRGRRVVFAFEQRTNISIFPTHRNNTMLPRKINDTSKGGDEGGRSMTEEIW